MSKFIIWMLSSIGVYSILTNVFKKNKIKTKKRKKK